MKKAQPDPSTDVELHLSVMSVVVALGKLLSLDEALPDFGQHLIPATEKSIGRLCTGSPRPVRQNRRRGTPVHHLEGRRAKSRMERSIIAILRP